MCECVRIVYVRMCENVCVCVKSLLFLSFRPSLPSSFLSLSKVALREFCLHLITASKMLPCVISSVFGCTCVYLCVLCLCVCVNVCLLLFEGVKKGLLSVIGNKIKDCKFFLFFLILDAAFLVFKKRLLFVVYKIINFNTDF